jgi:hypothetical protein
MWCNMTDIDSLTLFFFGHDWLDILSYEEGTLFQVEYRLY